MDRHVQKLVDAVHDVLPDELKEHAGVVTASVCALAWTLNLLNSDTDACLGGGVFRQVVAGGAVGLLALRVFTRHFYKSNPFKFGRTGALKADEIGSSIKDYEARAR